MEAPERLYLSKIIYSTYLYQVPDPDDETAVEYIRTDAFIDKACKSFCEAVCKGYQQVGKKCFADGGCDKYNDFRKAIEE